MIRGSRSHPENVSGEVSGSKSDDLKENVDGLLTLFFDRLKSTNNSLELVDPSALETLFKRTRAAFNDINWEQDWETILTVANCRNIGKNTEHLSADKKPSPLTENANRVNGDTVSNELKSKKSTYKKRKPTKAKTTLNTTKAEESSTLAVESTSKHVINPECKTTLNEVSDEVSKSTENSLDGQDNSLDNVNPSTPTKSLNKSTNKPGRKKSKLKTGIACKIEPILVPEDVKIESTSSPKKEKELPMGKTRSATKTALFVSELEIARTDFPINNLDWYYKDEQDFKNKCVDAFKCFDIRKERRGKNYRRSYNYMLFDLRKIEDDTNINLDNFIDAMFYIGKGTGNRAFQHAKDSKNPLIVKENSPTINEIWDSGNPFRLLFVKDKIKAEEAYTREAAMIDAVGLEKLCNKKRETYYDEVKNLDARQCYQLGVTLVVQALEIFKRKNKEDYEDVYRDE